MTFICMLWNFQHNWVQFERETLFTLFYNKSSCLPLLHSELWLKSYVLKGVIGSEISCFGPVWQIPKNQILYTISKIHNYIGLIKNFTLSSFVICSFLLLLNSKSDSIIGLLFKKIVPTQKMVLVLNLDSRKNCLHRRFFYNIWQGRG